MAKIYPVESSQNLANKQFLPDPLTLIYIYRYLFIYVYVYVYI